MYTIYFSINGIMAAGEILHIFDGIAWSPTFSRKFSPGPILNRLADLRKSVI
jgi:hypothetical protein